MDSRYNWLPINFYDPREGEVRDVAASPANTCSPNGVMNAIELDVGNLRKWLRGTLPGSGTLTDYQKQNGYVLFYSDRRGMQLDPTTAPLVKTGKYGFEDVINSGVSSGTPDGALELAEDVDGNGQLDRWGAANVGDGFGVNSTNNPFANRQACMTSLARTAFQVHDTCFVSLTDREETCQPVPTTRVGSRSRPKTPSISLATTMRRPQTMASSMISTLLRLSSQTP